MTHDWVLSPYHEFVICRDCGIERIDKLADNPRSRPAVTVTAHGNPETFAECVRFMRRLLGSPRPPRP